jgi:uncharacterized protein YgiM (DUF1202 family)
MYQNDRRFRLDPNKNPLTQYIEYLRNRSWSKVILKQGIAWLILVLLVGGIWYSARKVISTKSNQVASQITEEKLEVKKETAKPAKPGKKIEKRRVRVRALNLRTQPSKNSQVILILRKGTVVTVVKSLKGWYLVRTADGKEGYISAEPRYSESIK